MNPTLEAALRLRLGIARDTVKSLWPGIPFVMDLNEHKRVFFKIYVKESPSSPTTVLGSTLDVGLPEGMMTIPSYDLLITLAQSVIIHAQEKGMRILNGPYPTQDQPEQSAAKSSGISAQGFHSP